MDKILFITLLLLISACDSKDDSSEQEIDTFTESLVDSDSSAIIDGYAEIQAVSTEILTGNLVSNTTQNHTSQFIEQSTVQGKFGVFNITSTGNWSYKVTNLATRVESPKEIFTVETTAGDIHQVTILVKGLFQRITNQTDYFLPLDEPVPNMDGPPTYHEPIPVASLYTKEVILKLKNPDGAVKEVTYEYNDLNNISQISKLGYSFNQYLYGYNSPNKSIESYVYVYNEDKLSSLIKTEDTLYLTEQDGESMTSHYSRQTDTILFDEEIETNHTALLEYYNSSGDEIDESFSFEYRSTYNSLNKLAEYYVSYFETDNSNPPPIYLGEQLQDQHFYLNNGSIDYTLRSKTTPYTPYQGVKQRESYYYDDLNRISHVMVNRAFPSLIDGGYSYGELDYSNASVIVYNYIDELDMVISYVTSDTVITNEWEVNSITMTHYTDVDQCGSYHQLIQETNPQELPLCKVKTEMTSTSELPQL